MNIRYTADNNNAFDSDTDNGNSNVNDDDSDNKHIRVRRQCDERVDDFFRLAHAQSLTFRTVHFELTLTTGNAVSHEVADKRKNCAQSGKQQKFTHQHALHPSKGATCVACDNTNV